MNMLLLTPVKYLSGVASSPLSSLRLSTVSFSTASTSTLFRRQTYFILNKRPYRHHHPSISTSHRQSYCRFRDSNANTLRLLSTGQHSGGQKRRSSSRRRSINDTALHMVAVAVALFGLTYAAVPLYRIFCSATGYGGVSVKVDPGEKVEKMVAIRERELTIRFSADTSSGMEWNFEPQQQEIKLVPGETALAFYTASNPTDEPIVGVATYNVVPFRAGLYFNKIQCFCFEEQRLNPHEQVDMPVFFYIDPEFDDDPAMAKVDEITLSYTFFASK